MPSSPTRSIDRDEVRSAFCTRPNGALPVIALDTETELISPGNQAPRLVCVSGAPGDLLLHRTGQWAGAVSGALAFGVVGHNFAFDAGVMMRAEPLLVPEIFDAYDADRVTDTMLRAQLADIAVGAFREQSRKGGRGYSLGALCPELVKGGVQLRYGELIDTPIAAWEPTFRGYVLDDARATLDLYRSQPSSPDEYRQARAALWLRLASSWGLSVDHAAVAGLESAVSGQVEALGARLVQAGLARVERGRVVRNMRTVQEAVAGAYAAQGRDYPRTDGGAPACDREACTGSGNADLEAYAEYSSLGTMLSADPEKGLLNALRATTPIHTRFGLAESGRATSSKPNVQNLPRKQCPCDTKVWDDHKAWCCKFHVRECFVPRPGKVFVVADYAGAELATLAQVCLTLLGRSTLAEQLNSGIDPHLVVASQILRQPYDEIKPRKKTREVYDARQTGKVANFGLPGGLGAQTLVYYAKQSYNVTLTLPEATELKRLWLALYPEMRAYFDLIGRVVDSRGCVEQLRSERIRGGLGFCDACNTTFQGLAADMAKDAGWLVCREQYDARRASVLFGARTVNFVHDELVVECDEHAWREVGARVEDLMLEAARTWIPDVRVAVEWSAMTRYSKSERWIVS